MTPSGTYTEYRTLPRNAASARVGSPARSDTGPARKTSRCSTSEYRASSRPSVSPAATGATASSCVNSHASTCSSRTTGARTAAPGAIARPPGDRRGSLRHRFAPDHQSGSGRSLGTTSSPSRPWPMPCSTASSTMPTASNSPVRASENARLPTSLLDGTPHPRDLHNRPAGPPHTRPTSDRCWPASRRNSGRLQIGMPGRIHRNTHSHLRIGANVTSE